MGGRLLGRVVYKWRKTADFTSKINRSVPEFAKNLEEII